MIFISLPTKPPHYHLKSSSKKPETKTLALRPTLFSLFHITKQTKKMEMN